MAHKKRSPLKGRKHTKKRGTVKRHSRMVSGANPAIVSGTRKKRRTHKKVGAITGNDFLDALLGAGLGVAIGVVYDKMVPINNAKAKAGLEAALGLAASYFGAKKKNMFLLGVGLGVAADGIKSTAKEFGVIKGMENFMSGIGADPEDAMVIEMNGIDSQKMMGNITRGGADNVMGNAMPSIIS